MRWPTVYRHAMLAWLKWIGTGMGIAGAVFPAFAFDGGGAKEIVLAASNAAACEAPRISAKLTHHEEEVKSDLGIAITSSPGSPTTRRFGYYMHISKIGFTTEFEGQLPSLSITPKAVSSFDTSNPTYSTMAAFPFMWSFGVLL